MKTLTMQNVNIGVYAENNWIIVIPHEFSTLGDVFMVVLMNLNLKWNLIVIYCFHLQRIQVNKTSAAIYSTPIFTLTNSPAELREFNVYKFDLSAVLEVTTVATIVIEIANIYTSHDTRCHTSNRISNKYHA